MEVSQEFLTKLKESLKLIDSRLSAVEHIVNDVIIGGLQSAADEYADDEAYSIFVDTYGNGFKDLVEPSKVLYGDEYDLSSDLYETIKGIEKGDDFDEKAEVDKLVSVLRNKVEALRNAGKTEEADKVEEAVNKVEEVADVDVDEVSEDEMKELHRIYRGNI